MSRFVYAVSSSAYGDTDILPKVETMPANPLSSYTASKHVGEQYCSIFAKVYGLETVTLRYFNVFGPMQDPNSQYAAVIPCFVSALAVGEPPAIYGDGEETRDFTSIEHVVRATILAGTVDHEGLPGAVMNIGGRQRHSINKLLAEIQRAMGTNIEPNYTDPRPGDVRDSEADINQARRLLGYEPDIQLRQELEQTVAWFREHMLPQSSSVP